MKAVIVKEIRERKFSLLAYCLAAIGFIWLYVSLFPFLQSQSQDYNKLLESFPKGFSQAFGIDTTFLSSIQGYLAGEMYSLIWPLLVIILMASRASSAFAGEIEKGTIGTLLSQPISRSRLFFAKYVAGLATLVVFIIASVLVVIPVSMAYKIDFWSHNFLTLSFVGLLFGLVVYSFALLLSVAFSEKSKVYGVVGGVLFIMYALNIVAGLKPSLKHLEYTSVFHYFNASAALIHNHVEWLALVVFVGATILFSLSALVIFNKRDISI